MTDTTTQPTEAEDEAQALAAASKGYAARKGIAEAETPAPAPAPAVTPDAALAETTPPAPPPEEVADDEPDPSAQQKPPTDAEQLKAQLESLRAQVREMKESGADAKTVREMHGQIGEINATLKTLTALQQQKAPESDELADAIADAERQAAEYPEMGGTLLKVAKALQAKLDKQKEVEAPAPAPAATPAAPAQPAEPDTEAVERQRVEAKAKADLLEIHPDYFAVRNSSEFKAWFAKKPTEYQKKATSSWNPVVVAEPVSAYKAHLSAQKAKQDRLDAAAQPRGTGAQGQPTTLSDDEAARIGYERARRKRL
jgi:hypothetical protein